jgi:hypothetical protein
MTLRSPIVAMLWELWRLTRAEIAWKLALPIGIGVAALLLGAAFGPPRHQDAANINDAIAAFALIVIVLPQVFPWMAIAKLNGGQPGFPFYLAYTRPVRTSVIVGLPMAYFPAVSSAMYLVSAIVLRVTSGYAFPLLPVAAWLATLSLVGTAAAWSTRIKVVQVCVTMLALVKILVTGMDRLTAVEIPDNFDWPPRLWPTLFDFPRTDYAWIALIGLASFGVTIFMVTRQRRGDPHPLLAAPRALAGVITQTQAACPERSRGGACGAGSSACSAFRVPPRLRRGPSVAGFEVQRNARADDRRGARDRDSAGVGGQRAHRCFDQCQP